MFIFDIWYIIIVGPALLLGMWAQYKVRSTYGQASRMPASLSGAAAARHILDSAGLSNVDIEMTGGTLSDHYDPRHKVLRLSPDVYNGRSLAAVGIAAHEAGHAIQDSRQYVPLVVRNLAVPVAGFGSNFGMIMFLVGFLFTIPLLTWAGVALFAGIVFFQLVNLPVEFNASNRAKAQLVSLGIVPAGEMVPINRVLNAAAMTYLAATLQAILTLLYLLMLASGQRD